MKGFDYNYLDILTN